MLLFVRPKNSADRMVVGILFSGRQPVKTVRRLSGITDDLYSVEFRICFVKKNSVFLQRIHIKKRLWIIYPIKTAYAKIELHEYRGIKKLLHISQRRVREFSFRRNNAGFQGHGQDVCLYGSGTERRTVQGGLEMRPRKVMRTARKIPRNPARYPYTRTDVECRLSGERRP